MKDPLHKDPLHKDPLYKALHNFRRLQERDLLRNKWKLFEGLAEFANIRDDEAFAHFRSRRPDFFPSDAYDNVSNYPYWLNQIWRGGESDPYLLLLLGIEADKNRADEREWAEVIHRLPATFLADWKRGVFSYESECNFQRALYLLFQESWRARFCDRCDSKFIARRAAQKYCSTRCSQDSLREEKRKWWAEKGQAWRKKKKV